MRPSKIMIHYVKQTLIRKNVIIILWILLSCKRLNKELGLTHYKHLYFLQIIFHSKLCKTKQFPYKYVTMRQILSQHCQMSAKQKVISFRTIGCTILYLTYTQSYTIWICKTSTTSVELKSNKW